MRVYVPFCSLAALAGLALCVPPGGAVAPPPRPKGIDPAVLRKRPVTTAPGAAGDLLRAWWKDGTAAGNVGDWYDNRDRGHSELDLKPYPQLQKVTYSDEEVRLRHDWALQPRVLPHVVFGNSSTSAPPDKGGSNVRTYYTAADGLPFLHQHYRGNNLYVYPEHRDHDPGPTQGGGYGDLFPTNTPYLITSQGSSGSDLPFLRALPTTLAAFRPEVKKKLVEAGLLMPTVQMIFRASNSHLSGPKDYLTGKAHPSAFEGKWVDAEKMARMAHELRRTNVPPLVQLRVVGEKSPERGVDFFEVAGASEALSESPCVVARLWRGHGRRRTMTVSATRSFDFNEKPLTYHWVLLRGDPKRVKITPRNKAGSMAELTVDYHERRPAAPGSALESNRVEVGVFVHNGTYYSAPGFVTFYSLDCEGRAYDAEGRTLEVGYGMGETALTVTDYAALFAAAGGPAGKLLRLTAKQQAALAKAAKEYEPLQAAFAKAQKRLAAAQAGRTSADRARKAAEGPLAEARAAHAADPTAATKAELDKADAAARAAVKEHKKAEAEASTAQLTESAAGVKAGNYLDGKRADLGASPRAFADKALRSALKDPGLYADHAEGVAALLKKAAPARKAAFEAARARLIALRVAEKGEKDTLKVHTLRAGPGKLAERLTPYERSMLERFHGALLAELAFPGAVRAAFGVNFVDRRLTASKDWRDVYRHDAKGRLLGWTRYGGAEPQEFTAGGLLVLEKDAKGRPVKARTVRYEQDKPGPQAWVKGTPLRMRLGGEVVTFAYDGDTPRVKGREAVKERD